MPKIIKDDYFEINRNGMFGLERKGEGEGDTACEEGYIYTQRGIVLIHASSYTLMHFVHTGRCYRRQFAGWLSRNQMMSEANKFVAEVSG